MIKRSTFVMVTYSELSSNFLNLCRFSPTVNVFVALAYCNLEKHINTVETGIMIGTSRRNSLL